MSKKENQISLNFISDLKYTEFCVLVFGYLKGNLSLRENDFFQIEISLREVVNNAILHGNKGNLDKRVYVDFIWDKTLIRIVIRDENDEVVDFDAVSQRLEQNDLLAHHGRGIMIMKSYMDTLQFNPSSHGTEIIMEKKL